MSNLLMLWGGLKTVFSLSNLVIVIIGSLVGIIVGAVPGIGSLSACALLLPITYSFSPTSAILLLASLYYSTMFGGCYSAILLNIPGDSPAVMTALDGYPLARSGKAGKALMTANFSSFLGGLIGMLILTFSVSWLARVGLNFGNAEMATLLLVAGLTFLWPRPLKLQVNGENVWKGAVSISQEAEPMALLAVRTVSVPFTLDPGRGGTVTVDADTNSVLEQNGEEQQSLTLQKAAAFTWLLYPDDTQEFYLTVTQGQTEYLLRALVEESGSITLQRVQS